MEVGQGLETYAAELYRPRYLASLAVGYEGVGQTEDGLAAIAEALWLVEKNDERIYEAELYRIKGELALRAGEKVSLPDPQSQILDPESEAEACFQKAIAIAQKQQAKSLELRATMSLARLWQRQGKHVEARKMLAEIYEWFTEGFDTKDLQEAKMLIEALSHGVILVLFSMTRSPMIQ